jgi:hypothetical protein
MKVYVKKLATGEIGGVVMTLYENPDGHDYILSTSSALGIAHDHAAGCRRCAGSRANLAHIDKEVENAVSEEEWGVGGA